MLSAVSNLEELMGAPTRAPTLRENTLRALLMRTTAF